MSENPILMTQAEYARHRNKSPQYIGKLFKAGILVMRGHATGSPHSIAFSATCARYTSRRMTYVVAVGGGRLL